MTHEADEKAISELVEEEELSPKEKEVALLEKKLNAKLDAELHKKGPNLLWPRANWFIIPNEFGERFAYYGMKPLFSLYLTKFIGIASVQATIYTSIFNSVTYATPLIGATISDSFLGKYWTIVSLSVIYGIGVILMSVLSIPGIAGTTGVGKNGATYPLFTWLLPAMLMAVGTGGIKPCVSSHGGDQYLPHQRKGLDFFFSIFYVAINVGGLISGFATPYFKDDIYCWGRNCYFGAYMLCAFVFVIAMITFAVGKNTYRIVPPMGELLVWKSFIITAVGSYRLIKAVLSDFSEGGFSAVKKGSIKRRETIKHWLHLADDVDTVEMVDETILLGEVLLAILPISFYWMCYDQSGNEWQYQYDMMAGVIATEAFGNLNPIFIILLVPAFVFLYQFLEAKGIRLTILGRMNIGFFLMVVSYGLSGILQYIVLQHYDPVNDPDCNNCISGWWQVPQWFILSVGEAMVSPEGLKLTYQNVGKRYKAQSLSFWLVMVSIGSAITAVVNSSLQDNPLFNDLTSEIALANVDGGISRPNKYWLFTALCLLANIWFWAWGLFVFQYKDKYGSMTKLEGWKDRRTKAKYGESDAFEADAIEAFTEEVAEEKADKTDA